MSASILTSTKKVLGIAESYDAFDVDIIMHINSVFSTLHQLGVGPSMGFEIEDADAVWSDFIPEDPRFNFVKSYVYLKVRKIFDPPQTSFMIAALDDQIREFEWRINVERETLTWVPEIVDLELDGGSSVLVSE